MQKPGHPVDCHGQSNRLDGERRWDWAPYANDPSKGHGSFDHELSSQSNRRDTGHPKRPEPGNHCQMLASRLKTKTRISESFMKTQTSHPVKRKVLLVDDHACVREGI